MAGVTAVEHLAAARPQDPITLISASAMLKVRARCAMGGMYHSRASALPLGASQPVC